MVTRFIMRTAVVLAGGTALVVVADAPAVAQDPGAIVVQAAPNLRVERVGYGDLNLLTRAGADRLHMRVGKAVERVCLFDNHRWYGMSDPAYIDCSAGAWKRARPQMIGAIYRARTFAYNAAYRGY
jgi:UrcA family protein